MKKANLQKHFEISVMEESAKAATYFMVPRAPSKHFVQILSLIKNENDFVNVQLYLSNLVATELWAEIDVSDEYVPPFLTEMVGITQKESKKSISNDAQFEMTIQKMDKAEGRQIVLIEHLTDLENQIDSPKTNEAMKKKLSAKLLKVEEACIDEEIEISRLTFTYFSNTLDQLDPYFFGKLSSMSWSQKKTKKK